MVNKIDLAPYVQADLNKMREDSLRVRRGKPSVFISLKTGEGTRELIRILDEELGLERVFGNKGQ